MMEVELTSTSHCDVMETHKEMLLDNQQAVFATFTQTAFRLLLKPV